VPAIPPIKGSAASILNIFLRLSIISILFFRVSDYNKSFVFLPLQLSDLQIYQTYCASCHQRDGTGVDGRFPPITAPQWISGNPEPLISVILNGLDSPRYDIPMPNHEFLNEEQVAEVATYIRQYFGDEEDSVTEEDEREIRNPYQLHSSAGRLTCESVCRYLTRSITSESSRASNNRGGIRDVSVSSRD